MNRRICLNSGGLHTAPTDTITAAQICPITVAAAGNAHFGSGTDTEYEDRIEDYVCQRSGDLRDHRAAHVAARLMHLCPISFEKYAYASRTDDISVNDGVFHGFGRGRARLYIRTHEYQR